LRRGIVEPPKNEIPDRMNPDLMRVADVARRLNTSESFVYGLLADGRLKHYVLGKGQGAKRVSEAQLSEYLAAVEKCGCPPQHVAPPTSSRLRGRGKFEFLPPP
jgi:excisionase family DNA binding protein